MVGAISLDADTNTDIDTDIAAHNVCNISVHISRQHKVDRRDIALALS